MKLAFDFQIRLQHLFPQFSSPLRYNLCEEPIELTAECLANDVIRYLLKEDIYLISRDPISRSMRHNVYQMLNKHNILFTSMVNRLNVVPDTAYEAFMGVADELFLNGVITWARIVCLFAFMGRLALWARDRKMYALKSKLPLYVSRYIGEEITHFIKGYGGWVSIRKILTKDCLCAPSIFQGFSRILINQNLPNFFSLFPLGYSFHDIEI